VRAAASVPRRTLLCPATGPASYTRAHYQHKHKENKEQQYFQVIHCLNDPVFNTSHGNEHGARTADVPGVQQDPSLAEAANQPGNTAQAGYYLRGSGEVV
jgi:hypothetical protein